MYFTVSADKEKSHDSEPLKRVNPNISSLVKSFVTAYDKRFPPKTQENEGNGRTSSFLDGNISSMPYPYYGIKYTPLKSCLKRTETDFQAARIRSKAVIFSNDIGVKYFLKIQPPSMCSRNNESEDGDSSNSEEAYPKITKKETPNKNEIILIEENGPDRSYMNSTPRKVLLEKITFDDTQHIVFGTVRVHNLGFEKKISIRYTFDIWKTINELEAEFTRVASKPTENWVGEDIFSFSLKFPENISNGESISKNSSLEFCINYIVNEQEYWDNNSGKNYIYKIVNTSPKKDIIKPFSKLNSNNFKIKSDVLHDEFLETKKQSVSLFSKKSFLTAPKTLHFASFGYQSINSYNNSISNSSPLNPNTNTIINSGYIPRFENLHINDANISAFEKTFTTPKTEIYINNSPIGHEIIQPERFYGDIGMKSNSTNLSSIPIFSPSALRAASPSSLRAASPSSLRAASPNALRAAPPSSLRAASPNTLRAASPSSLRAASPIAIISSSPNIHDATEKAMGVYGYQGYSSSPLTETSPLIY
ncbi:Protein phosphatase 1 regulatory subunit 3C [Smittium culicis]|uniref:Protein phosphatase 1 regulatory subunit 3C n=1 Tax=Smittium culicis TaxID=133412 RepID=A0A1R1XT22_9FUNG|nr:Protein phosphatase 1 regulatory subunit 3C [Smittium culicis]